MYLITTEKLETPPIYFILDMFHENKFLIHHANKIRETDRYITNLLSKKGKYIVSDVYRSGEIYKL